MYRVVAKRGSSGSALGVITDDNWLFGSSTFMSLFNTAQYPASI